MVLHYKSKSFCVLLCLGTISMVGNNISWRFKMGRYDLGAGGLSKDLTSATSFNFQKLCRACHMLHVWGNNEKEYLLLSAASQIKSGKKCWQGWGPGLEKFAKIKIALEGGFLSQPRAKKTRYQGSQSLQRAVDGLYHNIVLQTGLNSVWRRRREDKTDIVELQGTTFSNTKL